MTTQRSDEHSTEFGLWTRKQAEIDSSLGFVATNIDFVWRNYKTGLWMLIEEKRHGTIVKFWQEKIFNIVDKACSLDKNYRGFHYLIFENTSPEDGKIMLDGKDISKQELIDFLMFK